VSAAPPPIPDDERVRAPRWTRFVPRVTRTPDLPAKHWKLLGLLGAAEMVDHYDVGLLSNLLVYIQAGLGVAEDEIGTVSAAIRAGVLLSLVAGFLADRIGRRRLLLTTVIGYTTTTFLTAFARTPVEFALLQCLGRGFLYAETAIAIVVITEELAAKDRGFGLGLLGALGATGYGLSAIALPLVDYAPFGWRFFYALGAAPMLWLAVLRRSLPETSRFAAAASERTPWWQPVQQLFTAYPGRLAALLATVFSIEFASGAAGGFMVKTLLEVHGYRKSQVTALYLLGGAIAVVGNQVSGQISDRVGRRPVLMALLAAMAAAFAGFYVLRGPVVAALWIAQVFALQGVTVLMRALGSELFPTSYRGTASTLRMAFATFGGMAGLFLESVMYRELGSHGAAITALLPALLVAAVLVWISLPESAARELEEVSPERSTS
jgi:putative MFS transporter